MDKFEMRRMKCNAIDELLRPFHPAVFSIADDGVPEGRKLDTDLILQSGHELDSDERSIRKKAFDRIPQFGTRRCRIACGAQLLIHSFATKIVHERRCLSLDAASQNCEIVSLGSVVYELPHQRTSVWGGFRKQKCAGGKTIDAMDHQCLLAFQFELFGEERPGGWSIRGLNRNSQKSSRFVENDHGVVLVKDGKLP